MKTSIMKGLIHVAALVTVAVMAGPAFANPCPPGNPPTNCGPPTGTTIWDLAGAAIPHTYTEYTTSFTATSTATALTFGFREDPSFWELDNVSVTTGGGPNLVTNPGFESGSTGWTPLNNYGAAYAGFVSSSCGVGGSACWYDGSVQAYDGLNQSIATTVGHLYSVSFYLTDIGGLTTAQHLSTNGDTSDAGGNGADVLVYAGAGNSLPVENPTQAPEMDAASAAGAMTLLLGALLVLRGRRPSR